MRFRYIVAGLVFLGALVASGIVCAQAPATVKLCYQNGATCTPVTPTTPIPSGSIYPFASAGTMQSQLSVTTGAVVTPTVPAGTLYMIVCVRNGAASAINWVDDGTTTPTTGATGAGRQLVAGTSVVIQGSNLINNFKMIAATATTAVDFKYDK